MRTRNRNRDKRKIIFHLHDDTSNCNGYADSCTNFKDYIELAKRDGDTAIAFSNHGGIYDWVKKKQACDKAHIKYIHGIETYICDTFQDNDRGYHLGLYAKNWDGVLELNTMISKSFLKGDGANNSERHMYHNPRMTIDEIMNTSDDIVVTTACIQSLLWKFTQRYNNIMNAEKIEDLDTIERQKYNLLKLKDMDLDDYVEYSNLKPKEKPIYLDKYELDFSVLASHYIERRNEFLEWIIENKHRCFLEVQAHTMSDQIEYNKMLIEWAKKYDIMLIAGTDTHSSNEYKAECRKILQISKQSFYGDEDACDLTWKTYDELYEMFKKQDVLSDDEISDAIDNTNVFEAMFEDYTLDISFKYPTLYGDASKKLLRDLVEKKYIEKQKLGAIDNNRLSEYRAKIEEELDVFEKQGMESFILFMAELLQWCGENNIPHGDRGSFGGSMVGYIADMTDIDPVVWKTVFSRFCNVHRISLGDIDVDFAPEDRAKVYEYIINKFTPEKTSYILTFGTLRDRSTIDVLSKGLNEQENDLQLVKNIKNEFDELNSQYEKIVGEEVNVEELEGDEMDAKNIDFDHHDIYISKIRNEKAIDELNRIKSDWNNLKASNKELFYFFDGIKGTIISKGQHPAGMIGSPITLQDNLAVHYKDGDKNFPISSCSMKAVDSLNYVKFDILGLKNLGIIKDAERYAGIEHKKAYQIDWKDEKVWANMIEDSTGVFQFEKDFAFSLLKDFEPKTITHMSMINAGLRPSGKSYRDRLVAGEFNKNPSKEIDDLLKDNNGFLIFQEDTIKFLTDICGFDGGKADVIRRCIGKKDRETLESYLPKILNGYCSVSKQPRAIATKEAMAYIQIIEDSSEYQFGLVI